MNGKRDGVARFHLTLRCLPIHIQITAEGRKEGRKHARMDGMERSGAELRRERERWRCQEQGSV